MVEHSFSDLSAKEPAYVVAPSVRELAERSIALHFSQLSPFTQSKYFCSVLHSSWDRVMEPPSGFLFSISRKAVYSLMHLHSGASVCAALHCCLLVKSVPVLCASSLAFLQSAWLH